MNSMNRKIFAIHDQAVEAYMEPFFTQALGQAIRVFSDALNDPSHPFAKHPEDYTLFELGSYDPATGVIDAHPSPKAVGNGVDFRRPTLEN